MMTTSRSASSPAPGPAARWGGRPSWARLGQAGPRHLHIFRFITNQADDEYSSLLTTEISNGKHRTGTSHYLNINTNTIPTIRPVTPLTTSHLDKERNGCIVNPTKNEYLVDEISRDIQLVIT